ncbi:F420H(2):quinone oxidoreductase [Methanosarcinales archaeon]|uniref:F420H2:quinone oxidoreductase, subunit K n=1 Tax=Candidatus Syntropharchaeum caldarium TaxID=1838285 RepID=A0A1F2P760_9EURY|nr:MAG: F420H2:quinone oxidoreductase, subunit K [Candidatus Syntrophoarchaeum caldarius]RLG32461.1 MAG: F420H(2):quinone oxidoreductase [Methanosarcinales archaeon]
MSLDPINLSIIYITSFILLIIGYSTAISSKDIVRLLISLELMFGAVFLTLIPLFSNLSETAFGITLVAIFTSSAELLVLIAAIILFDRKHKDLSTGLIDVGGDRV